MKELVDMQKKLFAIEKKVKNLEKIVKDLEAKVGQDVVLMRAEAKTVLEKASALVNPYASNTMTNDKG